MLSTVKSQEVRAGLNLVILSFHITLRFFLGRLVGKKISDRKKIYAAYDFGPITDKTERDIYESIMQLAQVGSKMQHF